MPGPANLLTSAPTTHHPTEADLLHRIEVLERQYRQLRRLGLMAGVGMLMVSAGLSAVAVRRSTSAPTPIVVGPTPHGPRVPPLRITGVLGDDGGVNSQEGVQVENPDAGLSVFTTANPGNTRNEGYLIYKGYNSAGEVKKLASISSMWYNPTAGQSVAMLRLNATKGWGARDDVSLRLYGGNGAAFFAPQDFAPLPGERVLRVYGTIIADTIRVAK